MKIFLLGAKLFHTDGHTDTMKLIVIFCNFANAPKQSNLEMNKKGISVYGYKLNKSWISQTTAALSLKNPGNMYVIFYSNEHLSCGTDPPHVKSVE